MLRKYLYIGLSIIILAILVYFKQVDSQFIELLSEGEKEELLAYLKASPNTLLLAIFFMIMQTLIANIKATNIIYPIADLYGYLSGTFVAWSGAMLGIVVVFLLIRNLLNPIIYSFLADRYYKKINRIIDRNGHLMIMALNLSKFLYFDILIYLAAISTMKFSKFLKAVAIGQFFSLFFILYSYKNPLKILEIKYMDYIIHYVFPSIILLYIINRIVKDRKNL
ncbi:VTT domain-containing protein [Gemella sp. 19428wG2_WT2a]|nr:VTT domain-containing protein [Gemella sp. 19428wG2_WT2a]TFU57992.1 hypothetical protein E4T67_05980 [Gemella sp. WT2a]